MGLRTYRIARIFTYNPVRLFGRPFIRQHCHVLYCHLTQHNGPELSYIPVYYPNVPVQRYLLSTFASARAFAVFCHGCTAADPRSHYCALTNAWNRGGDFTVQSHMDHCRNCDFLSTISEPDEKKIDYLIV